MKKIFAVLLITVLFSFYGLPSFAADVPTLRASYGITTHQEAFMVAMARGEKFKESGVWLKPVVEREKFDLYADGKKVARLNVIVTKSGSEATSLFAQDHLDLTTNSFPAMLSGIDRGTKIKVLAPLQADAIAMVARNDIDVRSWKAFQEYVKKSKKPVTVGYHSPTSAPKIERERVMIPASTASVSAEPPVLSIEKPTARASSDVASASTATLLNVTDIQLLPPFSQSRASFIILTATHIMSAAAIHGVQISKKPLKCSAISPPSSGIKN